MACGERHFSWLAQILFVIRNINQFLVGFAFSSCTMLAILRGRKRSGFLPELRRYWIYCEASGSEW